MSSLGKLRVVWTVLFLSQFFYGAILFGLLQGGVLKPGTPATEISSALVLGGYLVLFASAWPIPGLIAKSAFKAFTFEDRQDVEKIAKLLMPSIIVQLAIYETITLMGLVTGLLNRNFSLLLPGLALAIAGFSLSFPTEDRLKKLASPA